MSTRLPSLTALRAFEAAARHMSFAKAADELNVTPAALSFQIKSLEQDLGQQVFRRLNRAVELTEAGRAMAPMMSEAFEALNAGWRAAKRAGDQSHLTITAGPGFTSLWLAPRLFSFALAHPDIELNFSASLKMKDFSRDEVDLAIRFGQDTSDPGLVSREILKEWWTPMVAPALAEQISRPDDLFEVSLLHQDDTGFLKRPANWAAWCEAAGLPPPPEGGIHFNQADHAVSAAIAGAGAILGRVSLTEGALRDGRLVMPFDLSIRGDANYRMVYPPGSDARPHVAAFIDWVEGEMSETAALVRSRRFPDDQS